MASVNVTIRVEEETKRQFDDFCDNVGMNITTAFNMFIKAVLRTRELPFAVTDVNANERETKLILARAKESMQAMQQEAVINGTSEMTMDEIDAEIAAYRREKRGL
ncbi:MAG: type II toxin-antitoxin system RelB/DinJ family antitoxin [Clostridiales bacterium]|jgi:DNA-damage-inducible protein J|nr:type II toxin-antitoxin system RelB/DinJ family antitoxin [Clostridiales bacterium]